MAEAKAKAEFNLDDLDENLVVNLNRDGMLELAMRSVPHLKKGRMELFDLETAAQDTREMVAGREAEIYSDVCEAVDKVTGKPIFTNDGARKAEAAKRGIKDTALSLNRKQARMEAREIAQKRVDCEGLDLQIKIARDYMHGYN